MKDRHKEMLMRVPDLCDWVTHKGEDVVIMPNYEATVKANKPMVDVSHCMTKALNGIVLYTTQYNKKKFGKSKLSK